MLLKVLHRLRDHGNTVVVIEHNLDVIKTADWVVDLGPEGGDGGGRIVAEGTPEEIARHPDSYTGRYLRPVLGLDKVAKRAPARGIRTQKQKKRHARLFCQACNFLLFCGFGFQFPQADPALRPMPLRFSLGENDLMMRR